MGAGWNKGIPHKKETKQKISQTMRSNHRMHSWTEEELRQWSDDSRQQWQQYKSTNIRDYPIVPYSSNPYIRPKQK